MTEHGDPRENAVAERVNGVLKTEWMYDGKPGSWQEAIPQGCFAFPKMKESFAARRSAFPVRG